MTSETLFNANFADLEARVFALNMEKIMSDFDYQSLAARTCPAAEQHRPDLVPAEHFRTRLEEARDATVALDPFKKALAYGKPTVFSDVHPPIETPCNPDVLLLLHMILGVVTEAGELLEALIPVIFDGADLDVVNLQEEFGDLAWYRANALRILGQTVGENDRQNIAKLLARFPEKFDQGRALERDLDKERAVLEGQMTLSNVEVIPYPYVKDLKGPGFVLRGNITNDERGRFVDGEVVRTSYVKDVNRAARTVQTRNSTYRIGDADDFDALMAELSNRRILNNPVFATHVDPGPDWRVGDEIRIFGAEIFAYGPNHDRVRGQDVRGDAIISGKIMLQPFLAGGEYGGKYKGMLLVTDEVHIYRIMGALRDERTS